MTTTMKNISADLPIFDVMQKDVFKSILYSLAAEQLADQSSPVQIERAIRNQWQKLYQSGDVTSPPPNNNMCRGTIRKHHIIILKGVGKLHGIEVVDNNDGSVSFNNETYYSYKNAEEALTRFT